jgi:sugar transferase (PEP-CTERM/EpsH1 system associated)
MRRRACESRPALNGAAAVDDGLQSRILFLTHRVPFPPDKGDRIRSWNLLRHLSERHRIWLGCLADEPWTRETEAELASLCEAVQIEPLPLSRWCRGAAGFLKGAPLTEGLFSSPELRRWIREVSREQSFDVVFAFCSSMAPYCELTELQDVPAIVDLVDVDSEKWNGLGRISGWPLGRIYRTECDRLRHSERQIGRRSAAVLLVSQPEADLYRNIAPDAPTHVVENGVDADYFHPCQKTVRREQELVFVGALDYRPNVDGLMEFCDTVWPRILQRIPGATLQIVGRRPTRAVQRLALREGIQLHANVPDVRPHLNGATAAIAPLRIARGVQNKILEALACQTPVIASPDALVGLDLQPGVEVNAAASPDDWVAAIESLFGNPELRSQMAARGREFVVRRHNWVERLKPLDAIIDAVQEKRARRRSANHSLVAAVHS